MKIKSTLLLLAFSGLAVLVHAQRVNLIPASLSFESQLPYASQIKSPAAFLGYELGREMTLYAHAADYVRYLAEVSDRVDLRQYGQTYEGRPLYTLVISSPENLAKIEDLRQAQLSLVSLAATDPAAAKRKAANMPVVISLSYNIHGNEPSTTEAALQLAYRMAAAQDAETQQWLRQSILTLYICINPDGRDRYVYWYNGMRRSIGGEEPRDLEHYDPWPNGRSNHYWFDLNRDWVWGIHPESRGHAAEYQRWMPQVHVDYHEQGYDANYFTVPGEAPRNLLLPKAYNAWADTFGRAQGGAFDREGISYFSRDAFDFFYPGYGSSYPSVMGAIGMLTEQGGIDAGRAVTTSDGQVLTFRQRIYDHYLTSVATLRKSVERRTELLAYSIDAWNPANSLEPVQTYVLEDEKQGYLQDLVNMLLSHGVRVERARASFKLAAALDFRTGQTADRSFPAGSVIVKADQTRHLFIHSVLARRLEIEDSVMYDISTWSAPLAYNVAAYSSVQRPSVATDVIAAPLTPAQGLLGATEPAYAYVIDWNQRHAPRALAQLWDKGYRVRAAAEPFSHQNQTFPAGSLIIMRGRNEEKTDIATDMADLATRAQVQVQAIQTSRMDEGRDLGSARHAPLHRPRVALLVEPPFDTYTAGQVYFLFDHETELPVERIRASTLMQTALPKFGLRYGMADIKDYDVLILPGGSLRNLEITFPKEQRDQLLDWVRRGGVLVAVEEAAIFFSSQSRFNTLRVAQPPQDSSDNARYLSYADRENFEGLKRIPGAAFNARVDITHPLAFGLKPTLFSLRNGTRALIPDAQLQTVVHYERSANEVLAAGYASSANISLMAGKTVAGVLPVEKGKIVYLVDNPHFRMFWRGPSRMMQNAVMLLPAF